ncbi:phage tail protein [Sphingomonas sp. CBMAI 2297]|uniref:gp53-like domain-containing protein n=1 Tax=Sphingomonas sp. CBMAI 2297 TaxID=2991720 RepID=UPI002456DDA6|nr:hypothetical protein [Sphingomonas sp. CBMAI 2297]MDH4743152.1 phage tail protein [Sphingomonas sp. CBMAI 2297]
MPFQFIVTDAGRAALVNAKHNGTNAVTIEQVGFSGTPIVATPATTALPGEVKRIATISGSAVAADTMHVIVRDESADVFTVRSVAFYLSDGTLFGAYGQPAVIGEKSAQAIFLLAIDVIFADIAAAMIQFGNANFLNPPATTDTAGVVKLATDADALALASAIKALTPRGMALAFSAANVLARLLTVDGAGSGLDADLLDGQDGSYYTNITARLGYTPLNAVYYTGSEILGRLVAVDGAGSGLDADLLDGRHATDFALLSGAAFAGGVSAPSFNAAGAIAAGTALTRGGWTVWDQGNIAPWHVGNDGSGSGLDADLLDGRHATDFALLSGANFTGDIQFNSTARTFYSNNWASVSSSAPTRFINNANWEWMNTSASILMRLTTAGDLAVASGLNTGGAITQNGNQVWHIANDGAGSGLDADLLDGRQGSEFALLAGATFTGRVSATGLQSTGGNAIELFDESNTVATRWYLVNGGNRLSIYDPGGVVRFVLQGATASIGGALNVSGTITRAGSLVWDAANDGAGSGLDADLLDGQHGSYYADIVGRLGYTPVNRNGDTFLGTVQSTASEGLRVRAASPFISFFDAANTTRQGYIQHTGSTLALVNEVGSTIAISASWFQRGGNTIWDAGNDGAGSGLDADLLDGRHASDFTLLTDATRAGSNAYGYWEKRPNGVIEQWGMIIGPFPEGTVGIHYPIPFTDQASINLTPTACNFDASNRKDMIAQFSSTTTTDGLAYLQWTAAASSLSQADALMWRAIGR